MEIGSIIEGKSHSKKYQVEDVIRCGVYSIVFSGFCISDGSLVALKQIPTSDIHKWEKVDENCSIPSEVAFLQKLQETDGVLTMLDYAVNDEYHIIILERSAMHKELGTYFQDENTFRTEYVLKGLVRQAINICDAVLGEGIYHNDIHTENFLVSEENGVPSLKLIDFGIATWVTVNPKIIAGVASCIGSLVLKLKCYVDEGSITDQDLMMDFVYFCGGITKPKVKLRNLEQLLLHSWLN